MKSRFRRLRELPFNFRPPHHKPTVAALRGHRPRRRGQALLLAVLIMLLAALLSAGFLAVVSGNLNQSARVADKTRAIEASRAGIAYANAQLSGSSQGDLWRPIDVSPAPNTNDLGYDFYYSQLEKVQGWAAQTQPVRADYPDETTFQIARKSYRDSTYGKFPDPNQVAGDAPKFLVKVEEIAANSPANVNHGGEIKITSIGLSEDDPNVFHRSIAYKAGRLKSPWASALRSVSNWRFGDNNKNTGVPYATNPQIVNAATMFPANQVEFTVDVADKPQFSGDNVPFNVVIVKKDAAPSVRGAVVTKVENGGAKLTFARLEQTIGANETIQKAAAIGIGDTIDLLNTGTPAPYSAALPQPHGIRANGSVWLQGQIRLSNLSKSGAQLVASGALAIDGAGAKQIAENSGDIGPTNTLDASSNRIVSSSQNGFPGNLVLTAAAASDGVETSDLVDDGWNRIGAQRLGLDYSKGRDVTPFTPARFDNPDNLKRYRALAHGSAGGITIDNRGDIERVGTDLMTQSQLVAMLMSPRAAATPPDFDRLGVAAVPGATDVSLEQRHLRGWVGPDEFLARGALVELVQNGAAPQLRITLDARSDANPNGPDGNKTFRDDNGNLQTGIYARTFDWPQSGTLFAEGNLRVRGNIQLPASPNGGAPDLFPSLTIVSLGNIYIEGALSVDSSLAGLAPAINRKKLMLLARKNVIVNPTRAVIGRTDVATVATNTAAVNFSGTATARPLSVANALLFNKGDYVTIGLNQNKSVRGVVTEVDVATDVIKISSRDVFTIPSATAGAIFNVRSPLEARAAGEGATAERLFFSVVDTENAINRRVTAPLTRDSPNRNRVIFDHVGALNGTATAREGLNIKAQDFDALHARPADFAAVLTNKQNLDASGKLDLTNLTQPNVQKADKILRTYQSFSAPELREFDGFTAPSATKPLSQLRTEIIGTQQSRELPAPAGFRYDANLTNAAFATLPAHALAGVGLRYQPGATFEAPFDSAANQRRQDFGLATQPDGFTIPLATSVEYDLGGTLSNLLPNSQSRLTKYIGFDPTAAGNDDALTVDFSFYQPKTEIAKSTLDSRVLSLLPATDPQLTSAPQSLILKRSFALSDAATSSLLPDHRVRAMKLENASLNDQSIKPVAGALQINAFVYAQEGSWLVIPGDYFRSSPAVRGIADGTGKIIGSYIDTNNSKTVEANEYILLNPNNAASARVADLNRNGRYDKGEIEAALRFTRYNMAPIQFFGAICENQTAVVADVAAVAVGVAPVVSGAVQDWTDKWATYDDTGVPNSEAGKATQFSFIRYDYDPSLASGSAGANQLRVPVTSELIYQN